MTRFCFAFPCLPYPFFSSFSFLLPVCPTFSKSYARLLPILTVLDLQDVEPNAAQAKNHERNKCIFPLYTKLDELVAGTISTVSLSSSTLTQWVFNLSKFAEPINMVWWMSCTIPSGYLSTSCSSTTLNDAPNDELEDSRPSAFTLVLVNIYRRGIAAGEDAFPAN